MLSFPCYPVVFPYSIFSFCESTVENARWWRRGFLTVGVLGTAALRYLAWRRYSSSPRCVAHVLLQTLVSASWDLSYFFLTFIAHHLIEIFSVNRTGNRLNAGRLYGPRVLVVGNGPSAIQGQQFGEEIDRFDEVVRFNNFQNKVAGMEKWVGTKTTVHFSDGVLYPTYREYNVPGATVMLSLFLDRFMVSGSYLILRGGADLETSLTLQFMKDPRLTWIEKSSIERLKKELGLSGVKHPTSGMLAIDYFLHKEGVQLPVYIHGFDFFQGPTIHYYSDHEPLYERINNRIGVNMHSPLKEKTYVGKLIAEGKVRYLKDLPNKL